MKYKDREPSEKVSREIEVKRPRRWASRKINKHPLNTSSFSPLSPIIHPTSRQDLYEPLFTTRYPSSWCFIFLSLTKPGVAPRQAQAASAVRVSAGARGGPSATLANEGCGLDLTTNTSNKESVSGVERNRLLLGRILGRGRSFAIIGIKPEAFRGESSPRTPV